jgi:hypothetical protein
MVERVQEVNGPPDLAPHAAHTEEAVSNPFYGTSTTSKTFFTICSLVTSSASAS